MLDTLEILSEPSIASTRSISPPKFYPPHPNQKYDATEEFSEPSTVPKRSLNPIHRENRSRSRSP